MISVVGIQLCFWYDYRFSNRPFTGEFNLI